MGRGGEVDRERWVGRDGRAQGWLAASTPAPPPSQANPRDPAPIEGQDRGGHHTNQPVSDQGGRVEGNKA